MTKEQFIEMVQGLLASGDLQSDIRGRYAYNRVAAVTNQVCSSIFALDASFADQMAVPYEFEVNKKGKRWTGVIPVSPMNGSRGIRRVIVGDEDFYGNQGVTEDLLSDVLGGVSSPTWTLVNKVFSFKNGLSSWGDVETVESYLLPDILSMDDDQEFVGMDYAEPIAVRVVEIMKVGDSRPEEKINNTNQDAS
jgi:hypothetical protein